MRQAIKVMSGLWLVLIFAGCLDLSGDWAVEKEPGWMSESGILYEDGAVVLPEGLFEDRGPFGVINGSFLPACVEGRVFEAGANFFDGAGEDCLSLMKRPGHYDELSSGLDLVLQQVGDSLEELQIPDLIQGGLSISEVESVHWEVPWYPVGTTPSMSFWVDIAEPFEVLIEPEIEVWFLSIGRIYFPKFSIQIRLVPELGPREQQQNLKFEIADVAPYRDWADPIQDLLDRCSYNYGLTGCMNDTSMLEGDDPDWDAYHDQFRYVRHTCPGNMQDNNGLGEVLVGREVFWCLSCTPEEFGEYLDRWGGFHCLATDN